MKILIISDAWIPQVNGVVRTYEGLCEELEKQGHEVKIMGPADFPFRIPMPGYSEIKLALFAQRKLKKVIADYAPETIHIATEGPLGRAARHVCLKQNKKFITCYHTHFPDYLAKRIGKIFPFLYEITRNAAIRSVRKFHDSAEGVMAATQSLEGDLRAWGFSRPLYRLTRGVDLNIFCPGAAEILKDELSPIALYVGRVAIEKSLEDFLAMEWGGTKVVVGTGPDLDELRKKYKDALFVGKKTGRELADYYRAADVFVFPSRTDTFGIVLIEALACGLPVAAYDVTGPKDIITQPFLGALHATNLAEATKTALAQKGTAHELHDFVKTHYTWDVAVKQFLEAQSKAM